MAQVNTLNGNALPQVAAAIQSPVTDLTANHEVTVSPATSIGYASFTDAKGKPVMAATTWT